MRSGQQAEPLIDPQEAVYRLRRSVPEGIEANGGEDYTLQLRAFGLRGRRRGGELASEAHKAGDVVLVLLDGSWHTSSGHGLVEGCQPGLGDVDAPMEENGVIGSHQG